MERLSVSLLLELPGLRPAPLRIASDKNFPPEPPMVPMMKGAVKLPGKILVAASHRAVMVPTLRMLEHACAPTAFGYQAEKEARGLEIQGGLGYALGALHHAFCQCSSWVQVTRHICHL